MPTIVEDKLASDFPPDWQVTKYDQQADPRTNAVAGFDRRIMQSEGVKHILRVMKRALPRMACERSDDGAGCMLHR